MTSMRRRESTDSVGSDDVARRRRVNLSAFMPERVNAEISRRYNIDPNEVGSGGYGKVYVASDKFTPTRKVAIKKVPVFDEEKRTAFKKEADIMKTLDHPHICKLLETYDQGRQMFFVMEYCEGREVFDRIMDHGNISESSTAGIARQCAGALKYAHSHGIAHRDMKPENICYVDQTNDDIKVIDWGLGFYFAEARRMSSAVGSLTYAAPEVLESSGNTGYDATCDIWSLGVVMYVMLCGKPPFWGNYQAQLKRMKAETYPMSDSTWQKISDNAKGLIRAMLKCDPAKRCTLDFVLQHPWVRDRRKTEHRISTEVLGNIRKFSHNEQFFSLCVAGVARQLDHRSLTGVYQVFCDMDTNGDGVLTLEEVREGFLKIYGPDHEALRDIDEMFANLDLDGSGTIDYTEFCAAGLGDRATSEESVLWAAFKAFDTDDDDGRISKDEVIKVLARGGDIDQVWTRQVCEEVTEELFRQFDQDGNGHLDFEEFVAMMRRTKNRKVQADRPKLPEEAVAPAGPLREVGGVDGFKENYNSLTQYRIGRSPAASPSTSRADSGLPARPGQSPAMLHTISGALGGRAASMCGPGGGKCVLM